MIRIQLFKEIEPTKKNLGTTAQLESLLKGLETDASPYYKEIGFESSRNIN